MAEILALLAVGLAWLWVNLKSSENWLSLLSIIWTIVLLSAASGLAIEYAIL